VAAQLWNFPDRATAIGQMISAYLGSTAELDDATVHLLFSANRWEKRCAAVLRETRAGLGTRRGALHAL
jgi:thymidylate kinase